MAKNKPYTNPPRDPVGFYKENARVNRQFRDEEKKAGYKAAKERLNTTTIVDRLENIIGMDNSGPYKRTNTREANVAARKAREKVRNRNEGQREAGLIKAKYPSKGSR